jgi:hypothetical protein
VSFLVGGQILLNGMKTRFKAPDGGSIGPTGHVHLEYSQIYPDLEQGTILRPLDHPHEKTSWLMRPFLQDVTEILSSHVFSDLLLHSIEHGTWMEHLNLGEKDHPRPVMRSVLVGGLPVGWF